MDRKELTQRLRRLGMNKGEFAAKMGLCGATVYQWAEVPGYAVALVEALEDSQRLTIVREYGNGSGVRGRVPDGGGGAGDREGDKVAVPKTGGINERRTVRGVEADLQPARVDERRGASGQRVAKPETGKGVEHHSKRDVESGKFKKK